MERQAKQQKLFHLRTTTSASVREILNLLRLAGGDPELSNIATERTLGTAVERETRDLIAELPLLREDGGWFNCPIVMFDRLLPWLVGKSDKFRNILSRLHQDRPPMPAAPYKLLFYCDEATPGDVLRLDNRRKAMWLYCTIADAQGFLHYDAMWLPLCCIRATMIKALAGGWSAAFSRIMQALFIDDNCLQTGVVVPHVDAGRAALWFFRFGFLLADTQAIQFTLGAKGLQAIPLVRCVPTSQTLATRACQRSMHPAWWWTSLARTTIGSPGGCREISGRRPIACDRLESTWAWVSSAGFNKAWASPSTSEACCAMSSCGRMCRLRRHCCSTPCMSSSTTANATPR